MKKDTTKIQLVIEVELANWLKDYAQSEGLNRSALIRTLVINFRKQIEGKTND
ncbi:MAG: hypothetical protein F6K56_03135 [Moorea sp. SIO3G5]|nr:hypothetical protein [Moorena sp. SIO3G5]